MRGAARLAGHPVSDPLASDRIADAAVDDPELRESHEWLQALPPSGVLKGCLRHDGHSRGEQRAHHLEEQRKRPARERILHFGSERLALGVDHAFLDLIAANGRARDRPRDQVRESGLA
jgi:hypothetical protein